MRENQIIITSKHFLTEGGCNACGLVNCDTYTLYFADRNGIMLSDMDVDNLVSTIVVNQKWRQSYESIGLGEEAPVFEKDGAKVTLSEMGKFLRYDNGREAVLAENKICDEAPLFEKVNEVLKKVFEMVPYEFSIQEA